MHRYYWNDSILKLLNSNVEDPYIIWNDSTRREMLDFVEKNYKTVNQNEYHNYQLNSCSKSELYGAEFKLGVYASELIVGDIFVRIYNAQPEFRLHVSTINAVVNESYKKGAKKSLHRFLGLSADERDSIA